MTKKQLISKVYIVLNANAAELPYETDGEIRQRVKQRLAPEVVNN